MNTTYHKKEEQEEEEKENKLRYDVININYHFALNLLDSINCYSSIMIKKTPI